MDRVTMPSKIFVLDGFASKSFKFTHVIFCIVTYDNYMGKLHRKVTWDKKRMQH